MSGDVQPRRRKDKKRKKEDSTEQLFSQTHTPLIKELNEDVNIHVHKEGGTGGGICAKIVFFLLFSALIVLIGLIITEHRGLTDIDTPDTESRFSQIFEEWTDNNIAHEDDNLDNSPEEYDKRKSNEEEHSEEIEENESEPISEDESNITEDEDEDDVSETEDVIEDENITEESKETEEVKESKQEDDEEPKEDLGDSRSEEVEEIPEEEPDNNAQNSRMPVKIGVGFCLLVVAYIVLIRKWKSASSDIIVEEKEPIIDLTRRNTLVAPPSFQEIQQDIAETIEEDYSDEEEVESEIEEKPHQLKSVELKYQELRQTYSRSLTPESEQSEEEYEEEIEDDEDEDDELLKRLEEKYGKLHKKENDEEFESWKNINASDKEESDSDQSEYEYENITNKDDAKIKNKLDEAQKTIKENTAYAIKLFDVILEKYPSSPRSLYGKAQALDLLADQKRSNEILQQAINVYLQLLNNKNTPNVLFEVAAEQCINRMRFIGHYTNAVKVHDLILERFPDNPKYRNQLAVTYLTINKIDKARFILKETLSKYPNDGFALVHYGFILKTTDNNLNESIRYLSKGIKTKQTGVIDGRFYFHLGDALTRLGRNEEAIKVYGEGVKYNLFLSKYQRSLYNIKHLKGQPWWLKEETPFATLFKELEENWKQIRNEGLSVLNKQGNFQSESENLKDTGDWKQFELFARGQKNKENCKKCPITCRIVENHPDARSCKRGQTKFSVMHPGTHIWPHCGPTNCRLRIHLGLKVPKNTFIRVANKIRTWEEGKVFIFDDSFEHEVWHNGTEFRLVLIVDIWHPDLSMNEKKMLTPI